MSHLEKNHKIVKNVTKKHRFKIFLKKYLLFFLSVYIIVGAVTLIAMKREVAACHTRVFRGANVKLGNWRQVTVQYSFCEKQINRDDNRELSGDAEPCARVFIRAVTKHTG